MTRIKIVATYPARSPNNRDSLLALARAGMSVARLNGSHSDLDWHRDAIRLLRATLPNTPILSSTFPAARSAPSGWHMSRPSAQAKGSY